MEITAILLNLIWSVLGLGASLISLPEDISFSEAPPAVIIGVESFWWYPLLGGQDGVRAMTYGNVVLMGPKELNNDLEHELIHVEQYMREPFIHKFLYLIESYKNGYEGNKYEEEAYERSRSFYDKRNQ